MDKSTFTGQIYKGLKLKPETIVWKQIDEPRYRGNKRQRKKKYAALNASIWKIPELPLFAKVRAEITPYQRKKSLRKGRPKFSPIRNWLKKLGLILKDYEASPFCEMPHASYYVEEFEINLEGKIKL